MSIRQITYDKPRRRRARKRRAVRLFVHSVWERLMLPYYISCPKGHQLGRGSAPFAGEAVCKKCKKTYSGVWPVDPQVTP